MNNKITIINGPNLNLLGEREQTQYGSKDYKYLEEICLKRAKDLIGFNPQMSLDIGYKKYCEWYIEQYQKVKNDLNSEGDGFIGFIHNCVIDYYLNDHESPEDIELYFCGPPLMNQAVQKMGEDFGIPDENKGSKIILSIVPLESEKNLKESDFINLIIKDLGKSFKPDRIIFVKDLPKTRNLKIMRRVIKSCLINEDPGDISTLLNPESVEEIKEYAV